MEGDLLFNTRNTLELVGKVAIWRNELPFAVYNSNLLRMKFNENKVVSNYFMNYLFNSDNALNQLRSFAIGTTSVAAIYTRDLLNFEIGLPPLPEQTAIANLLSTWDKAIENLQCTINNLQLRKKWLMQQLLSGKKRLRGNIKRKWNEIFFDDLFQVINGKAFQLNKSEYLKKGKYPIVDQGQNLIVGFSDNKKPFNNIPIIIFGDHTRIIKFIDFSFFPGADGTQLFKTKDIADLMFGYYVLCNTEIPNLGYSRHMRELKEYYFKIPESIEEQKAIAKVLKAADKEINLQKQKLEKLKEQKKGLMQVLLTGKIRVPIISTLKVSNPKSPF
jgi:type I restriction enzyme S subunit